jgi:valyl-tRNA synthetase
VVGDYEVYVPLSAELVAAERERVGKRIAEIRRGLEGLKKKLSNDQFISKAPPEIVERERTRAVELADQLAQLEAHLGEL